MGQLEDLASALDAETNTLASKLDSLQNDLKAAQAAGQAPSQATIAKLSAISDRLKSLGSDPATPIPPPTTDPAGTPASPSPTPAAAAPAAAPVSEPEPATNPNPPTTPPAAT